MANEPNFLEIEKIEDANLVDMCQYTLLCFSETRNKFIFKKRKVKL